jgi:glycosyltransferase involved in cell wall biosynthesis/uncharacterized coiled-coil protein SlyX
MRDPQTHQRQPALTMPRISVIIPSYNHGKYIDEAIQSVLDQDYQDFEIVITDDASTDDTVERIKQFDDPRIRVYEFNMNRGAAAASNHCIAQSTSEYISVLNSDDAYMPDKLGKQVRYLDEHPQTGAVFGRAKLIDEEGADFRDTGHAYYAIFHQPNRTRCEWLNHFFFRSNCLCHPSVMIRRKAYDLIGLYDERLAQLPDLDCWIRLCLKFDIHIIQEELVRFRIRDRESNASAASETSQNRLGFEFHVLLDNYLRIESVSDLLQVFPEVSSIVPDMEDGLVPYFVAKIAWDSAMSTPMHKLFAARTLYTLLGDKQLSGKIKERCDFSPADLSRLLGGYDIFNIALTLEREICALRSQLVKQESTLAEQESMLAEQESIAAAVRKSLSWRMTAPMRAVADLIKSRGQS